MQNAKRLTDHKRIYLEMHYEVLLLEIRKVARQLNRPDPISPRDERVWHDKQNLCSGEVDVIGSG